MNLNHCSTPNRWLAFELSVLRRLKFASAIDPFAGDARLGARLKRWGVRVIVNDIAQWAWTCGLARVQNDARRLTEEDLALALEDAYVPRQRLQNEALRRWFKETDAIWLDNVRANIERIPDPMSRAAAMTLALMVGDYALSFDERTEALRQPLSQVFRQLWMTLPSPIDNQQQNLAFNDEAREFILRQKADLIFIRLPRPRPARRWAWRETWVRGNEAWMEELELKLVDRLGTRVASKRQYLRLAEETFEAASHIPLWVIEWTEDGFISAEEIATAVNQVRKVETIYAKDFSELTNGRATIITAT